MFPRYNPGGGLVNFQLFEQDFINQRAFARTGYPGDTDKYTQWYIQIHVLQVVLPGSLYA
ncbi:hypothetical protein D3C81_2294050 [compost metagenome]